MKHNAVNLSGTKLDLIAWLLNQDDNIIQKLELFREQLQKVEEIMPLSIEEYVSRIQKADAEIEAGNIVSLESVRKESKKW